MARRRPLSVQEHVEIGVELIRIEQALHDICMKVANNYGVATRVGKMAMPRLPLRIRDLRYQLESEMARDAEGWSVEDREMAKNIRPYENNRS